MYETYTDKNGKVCNIYNCGKTKQDEMIEKGYIMRIPQTVKKEEYKYVILETPQEMYDRLSKTFSVCRIYYTATIVRNYHSYFAFCKR